MIKRIILLFYTLKSLRLIQVFYQLKYRLLKPKNFKKYKGDFDINQINFLPFHNEPPVYVSFLGDNKFNFLNQEKQFSSDIDWNFQEYGKLWNYNLQYGNYLLQENIPFITKRNLILSFYQSALLDKVRLEPYPASLRVINIIRLYSRFEEKDYDVLSNLAAELNFLSRRPEYHLLGNHLLENAFALMMGGAFFSNMVWVEQGQKSLEKQLEEQVLGDGAHFELSPMYHQIIFFRLLELIDWYSSWKFKNKEFEILLRKKARNMRSWLENISFPNGDIPHFNDSAEGISYSTKWLITCADSLDILSSNIPLSDSGYRSITKGDYECKIDFAAIGPDYQPGHAHADSLSFIVYHKKKPLFVEAGTSTYQIGRIRTQERSTFSHNTVVVNGENQSQIWGGFRVGRRAKTSILKEASTLLSAEHDGYKNLNIIHRRDFDFTKDFIKIDDHLRGNDRVIGEFLLHISPGLKVEINNEKIHIGKEIVISFSNNEQMKLLDYEMANGYNQYLSGKKIVVQFRYKLETKIKFLKTS